MATDNANFVTIHKISQQHAKEKHELQQLNENFTLYIKRVKDLEERNRQLRMQLDAMKNNWGFDSIKLKEQYDKDLTSARKELDTNTYSLLLAQIKSMSAHRDKCLIEQHTVFFSTFINIDHQRTLFCTQELEQSKIELDGLQNKIQNKKQEIEQTKAEMQRQFNSVQDLNKKFDDELLARILLEIELQTFREELIFKRAIYEEELNELAMLNTFHIDAGQFYRDELVRAVARIKKDFEEISAARYTEWEGYYKTKVTALKIELEEYMRKRVIQDDSNHVSITDMKSFRSELDANKKLVTQLHTENSTLINRMEELRAQLEKLRLDEQQSEALVEQQIAMVQAKCQACESTMASLHENNVSLQFEINTYRRLLEASIIKGVTTEAVVKTREIALLWSNSATANFSATDSKNFSTLQWAENINLTANVTPLSVAFVGPKSFSGVSFLAAYYKANERVIVEVNLDDQFNFYNYGQYQITIFYPKTNAVIGTWAMRLEPKTDICMPKQFIIRDSVNNILADTTLQLILNGAIVFKGTTNALGEVNIPKTLQEDAYEVEINTHKSQYKIASFRRIVFQNRGPTSLTYFIYRQMNNDEVEFLLTWSERPSDLDSHVYVSDGRHVYFSHKQEPNVSLDYDCRDGNGPETIRVKLEPNMKYIYAVHRYSKDGELPRSDASVTISTNDMLDSAESTRVVRVPYANQPNANFWIVCSIDGTTKRFKFFDRKFEDQDECNTDHFIRRYFDE